MPLPKYKDIVELLKKGATLEAQEKILELREAAIDLQEENINLKEELSLIRHQLKDQQDLTFDGNVYWIKTDEDKEGPFCPRCNDVESRKVRLHEDGNDWWCNACDKSF